jgi:hypothetical protein
MRVLSPKLNEAMVIPEAGTLTEADQILIKDMKTLPDTVDHNIAFGRTRWALTSIWEVLGQ